LSSTATAAGAPRNARIVVIISFLLVLAFGVWGLLAPDTMTSASVGLLNYVLNSVGWLYLALCTGFVILAAVLALSPYGRLRLGPDDSRPEFSTASWLAMLFAGGMGSGLVFWGVAEPITHFAHPPGDVARASAESARLSMVTSADSGTFVISMMTSEGRVNPGMPLKLAWGTAITLLTLAILLSGSVAVAKAMAAFGAVPFTLILVLQLVAFLRALREEPIAGRRRA
jgi:choline-glycine betaine transporter